MKTIIQILCCFAVFGIFFGFYCLGDKEEQLGATDFDAYHQKGVTSEPVNFDNMWINSTTPQNLVGYNKYKYQYTYIMKVRGKVDKATLKLPIPNNTANSQYISDLKLNPKPYKIFEANGNSIAEYKLTDLKEGQYRFTIEGIATLKKYDIDKAKAEGKNSNPERDIRRYLIGERGIETNHQYIKDLASKITGNSQEQVVANIFRFVKDKIEYTLGSKNPSAVNGLKSGRGQCGELAAAMVALCRAKGIPARIVSGNIARSADTPHTWVEVYYPQLGWVLYDPTVVDSRTTVSGQRTIANNNLDYIASLRNDFTPWYLTYSNTNTGYSGDIVLKESIKITRQ